VQFHALVERSLTRDVALRREPTALDPHLGAEQLVAVYEGLQLQSLMRPEMDLLDAFDRTVERLRIGWAEMPSHVWEL
jgi:hypothetical protein